MSTTEWMASDSMAELPLKAAATNFVAAIATFAPIAANIVLFEEAVFIQISLEHADVRGRLVALQASPRGGRTAADGQ